MGQWRRFARMQREDRSALLQKFDTFVDARHLGYLPYPGRAGQRMQKSRKKAKIQSLSRADAIFAAIAAAPDGRIRLSELSEKLGLHKNSAFSLLETLQALGYVDQIQSRQYMLGHRLFELARLSEADLDIVQDPGKVQERGWGGGGCHCSGACDGRSQ